MTLDRNTLLEAAKVAENTGTLGNAQTIAAELLALAAAQPVAQEQNNAAGQELPAVKPASRQQDMASSTRSLAGDPSNPASESQVSAVRDSAKRPAPAAPDAFPPDQLEKEWPRTPATAAPDRPTTRTDALQGTFYLRCDDCPQPHKCEKAKFVHPDDARQLERELAGAKATIERQGTAIESCKQELAEAQEKADLLDDLREMLGLVSEKWFNTYQVVCDRIAELEAKIARMRPNEEAVFYAAVVVGEPDYIEGAATKTMARELLRIDGEAK